jgi:hypothetical protein
MAVRAALAATFIATTVFQHSHNRPVALSGGHRMVGFGVLQKLGKERLEGDIFLAEPELIAGNFYLCVLQSLLGNLF